MIQNQEKNKHINSEYKAAADYFRKSSEEHKLKVKLQMRSFILTGIIVMALVAVLLAILAWFSNNDSVSAKDMSVSVKDKAIKVADYEIYKHNIAEDSYEKHDSKTTEKLDLNYYDAVMDENVDTQVYFRIPVKSEELEDSTENKVVRFTVKCDSDAAWVDSEEDETEQRYFSSILQVKCNAFPTVEAGSTDKTAEYYYKTLSSKFSSETAATFVKITNDVAEYDTKELVFDIPAGSFSSTSDTKYIYVEMDYNTPLIKKYLGLTNDQIDIDKSSSVNIDQFLQDIIEMDFEVVDLNNDK